MKHVKTDILIDYPSGNCYNECMTNEEFYLECAKLLGTTYDCVPFPWTHSYRSRWNNRNPGSGRYPGFGIIRCYGNEVHVALTNPVSLIKTFENKEDALIAISLLV